jgi:hypothetical protein
MRHAMSRYEGYPAAHISHELLPAGVDTIYNKTRLAAKLGCANPAEKSSQNSPVMRKRDPVTSAERRVRKRALIHPGKSPAYPPKVI